MFEGTRLRYTSSPCVSGKMSGKPMLHGFCFSPVFTLQDNPVEFSLNYIFFAIDWFAEVALSTGRLLGASPFPAFPLINNFYLWCCYRSLPEWSFMCGWGELFLMHLSAWVPRGAVSDRYQRVSE